MNKRKFAAALAAVSILMTMSACSKNRQGHTELPDEHSVVLTPNYNEGESEYEYGKSESSEESSLSEQSGQGSSAAESGASSSAYESAESEHGEEQSAYDELILVNPTHYIPDDYTVNLVTVQGKYKLDEKAAEHAMDLLSAAKKAGYDMQLCSAYRTVEKSAELYQRKVNQYINAGYSQEKAEAEAAKWVAPPGTSEHHTGLAMDLVSSDYWKYYSDLEHDYEKFDSFKWMYEHCAEYGFILRYPKDKQDITGITYEPWHYRYVGADAAKYIMENGLCLEEYLGEAGK